MLPSSEVRPDLTILADVAANVFAICLLILLVLLAADRRGREAGEAGAGPVEARGTFEVVERSPLGAGAMIAHLRARLAADGGPAIDVLPGGNGFIRDGRPAAPAAVMGQADRRPVRLYVFEAGGYGAAIAGLHERGLSFVEMSVPRALRRADGAGWSTAFLALAPLAGEPDRFRDGLARLLGGGDEAVGTGLRMPPAGDRPQAGLLERLRGLLSGLAAVAIPVLAAGAVLLVESGERRRLARHSSVIRRVR